MEPNTWHIEGAISVTTADLAGRYRPYWGRASKIRCKDTARRKNMKRTKIKGIWRNADSSSYMDSTE